MRRDSSEGFLRRRYRNDIFKEYKNIGLRGLHYTNEVADKNAKVNFYF